MKLSGLATGAVLSGGAVVRAIVGARPVGAAPATQATKVELAYPEYPSLAVAKLADLKVGEPVFFEYPQAGQKNMLVKLGAPAEEGIGPDGDIVAFSAACPHMGAPLDGVYNKDLSVLGPCPLHFSTFDLAKSGTLIVGKSTQPLPQVVLEADDAGEITATGMYGLIYGWPANLMQVDGGN
ncbi:MAG: arsenate reductase (azurin) small subunit [Thermomicrobiales bacterium]